MKHRSNSKHGACLVLIAALITCVGCSDALRESIEGMHATSNGKLQIRNLLDAPEAVSSISSDSVTGGVESSLNDSHCTSETITVENLKLNGGHKGGPVELRFYRVIPILDGNGSLFVKLVEREKNSGSSPQFKGSATYEDCDGGEWKTRPSAWLLVMTDTGNNISMSFDAISTYGCIELGMNYPIGQSVVEGMPKFFEINNDVVEATCGSGR